MNADTVNLWYNYLQIKIFQMTHKWHYSPCPKYTIDAIQRVHSIQDDLLCTWWVYLLCFLNVGMRFLCGENVSEVCIASLSNNTLSAIQILSQYGGTESLKRKRFGNNRKTEVWRSGWALQGIMSITSWREKRMEGNNFDLMAVFKSVALAIQGRKASIICQ